MAVEKDEAETTRLKAPDPPTKLSHKQFRKLVKKERRRKKRQEAAKRSEQQELEEKWRLEHDPVLRAKVEAREKTEKKRLQQEEDERQVQHRLWLEREAIAQEKFRKHKADEERKLKEKLEQEERIKREWEEQQRKEKEREERKQQQIKEKEEAFFKELDKPSTASERNNTWHNPLAPSAGKKSYGTEQDTVNCSFYLKTGACRFGERCSRHHPRPTSSVTLMIPAMYNDIRLSQSMLDEADHDTNLEYDEKDAYENFKQFFEDTLPEFKRAGTVVQFKVCCNHEPHLRGNVYVQFTSEEECAKAFAMFNARWYASKQLSCEFSPVTKWKSAICGLFERNRCPRGKNCNFLHVYLNPGNEFRVKDDLSPGRTPYSDRESERSSRGWRRDQWSRSRDLGREASHERGLGRETSHDRGLGREASHDRGLGREASHDRGLERDKWRDRDRDRGERDWSRERENRSRSRRRDDEREYSRMSERQERREGSRRVKADHNSEEEGEENGHQSERLSPGVEGSKVTENGSEHPESPHSPTENRKRKHRSSDKHSRRRKSKKKHKHRSTGHKKKKRHNKSDSDSSSSDSENGNS